ncbi:MAG: hypothetical protein FWF97_02085 [Alphaproteobacteria bacterium]|nr:hypothetical protein [Alphaproteobacteria bacterium]
MRYILGIFLILLSTGNLLAGQVANVQFIHNYIMQRHDITVPIKTPSQSAWAANMKYMLCAVDAANMVLNGKQTSDWCNNATYATLQAVDDIVAIKGISELVICQTPCENDFYQNGKVMRCVNGCQLDWENCPRNETGLGTCGCSASDFPNGSGSCEGTGPCERPCDHDVYYNGRVMRCVDGCSLDWENCARNEAGLETCGCPDGTFPTGDGDCEFAGECQTLCDHDIYDNGRVMRCVSGCLRGWRNCPRDETGFGTCGCSASTYPTGSGKCALVTPCKNGEVADNIGEECTCSNNAWKCVNCPACGNLCGCPDGQIPNGEGNCVIGLEPCIQGDVQYLLQADNTTILAKNCPMSGFRDFCPLIVSKVPDVCGNDKEYRNRPGWGDAYLENCCTTDDFVYPTCFSAGGYSACTNPPDRPPNAVCKADAFGGNETSFINIIRKTHRGRRMVYVNKESNGQLTIVRGLCRRMYGDKGTMNMDSCQQVATNVTNDPQYHSEQFCPGGMQLNSSSYKSRYLCDFPI